MTRDGLAQLADAGFTRVSFGMQSAVPAILATLDRTHTPERVPLVVQWAKEAGLSTSVDLIYGTPGESLADWETSLRAALSYETDHISAYALVVEEGTKMGGAGGQGRTADPPTPTTKPPSTSSPTLSSARPDTPGTRSPTLRAPPHLTGPRGFPQRPSSMLRATIWRTGGDWGLVGVSDRGAHSHVGKARWWNVKNPGAYAGRVRAGGSPAAAGEILGAQERELERVMLGLRTSEGVELDGLPGVAPRDEAVGGTFGRASAGGRVAALIADGLIDGVAAVSGRAVLTLRGRLLADYVTRELMGY